VRTCYVCLTEFDTDEGLRKHHGEMHTRAELKSDPNRNPYQRDPDGDPNRDEKAKPSQTLGR
jgi:hypothetical protein